MFKKFTALIIALVMLFSLTACEIKSEEQAPAAEQSSPQEQTPESGDTVVAQALALIDKGDIEGAYDLLYNIKKRNEAQEELFSKFAFAQTEIKKILDNNIVYTKTLSYNEDGYLLNRTVVSNQDDSPYTFIETSTYDENNNILSYNSNGTGGPAYISHTYDENDRLISRTVSDVITETFTYHSNGQMATYVYKNPSAVDYIPIESKVTFDENGSTLTTANTYKDGSTRTGISYAQNDKTSEISNYSYYLNDFNEEINVTYDENGNKVFEAHGYIVTCDKYNNAIKCENNAGGTDDFGLIVPERPDEYYSYKLFYYPDGAPQVYSDRTFYKPIIMPQYSNFYYSSGLS